MIFFFAIAAMVAELCVVYLVISCVFFGLYLEPIFAVCGIAVGAQRKYDYEWILKCVCLRLRSTYIYALLVSSVLSLKAIHCFPRKS